MTGYRLDVERSADPAAAWLDLLPFMAADELRSVLGEQGAGMLAVPAPERVASAAWNRPEARDAVALVLAGLHGHPYWLLP